MIETPFIKIWIEEGILCAIYAENIHVDIEIAKSIVHTRIMYSKGISYPALANIKGMKSVTKEAR